MFAEVPLEVDEMVAEIAEVECEPIYKVKCL